VKVPKGPVVTDADGSPGSSTPLLMLSNQTMPVAPAAKPEPETVTVVPGGPLVGDMLIDGVGTVNVAEASTGPPDGTSALMKYVPAGTSGVVRVAVKAPVADAVTDADGSPASNAPLLLLSNQTMPVAPAAKPEPETVTVVPGGPLVGLRDIAGVTVNVTAGAVLTPSVALTS
jgi:hypothetical protein